MQRFHGWARVPIAIAALLGIMAIAIPQPAAAATNAANIAPTADQLVAAQNDIAAAPFAVMDVGWVVIQQANSHVVFVQVYITPPEVVQAKMKTQLANSATLQGRQEVARFDFNTLNDTSQNWFTNTSPQSIINADVARASSLSPEALVQSSRSSVAGRSAQSRAAVRRHYVVPVNRVGAASFT